MLLNRLQDHAFGEVEMTPTQIQAAQICLKKSMPDLAAMEHTGPDGGALIVEIVKFASDTPTGK